MSYQEQSDLYRNPMKRSRMDMCVREQGQIFSADAKVDIKSLGISVVGGNASHIDAVIAAICCGPNWSQLEADDGALLSAVQSVWPTVAAALFPSA